jgi:large subunit ribosomal protein L22
LDKLLTSAIANWGVLTDEEADDYELVVSAIWVDQGSQLKRFRPAPHGRAHRIRKHFCHVTLQVTNTKTMEIREVNEEVAYEEVEETE